MAWQAAAGKNRQFDPNGGFPEGNPTAAGPEETLVTNK
jgi:hypothetical protein